MTSHHPAAITASTAIGALLLSAGAFGASAATVSYQGPDRAEFVMTGRSPGQFAGEGTEWQLGYGNSGPTRVSLIVRDHALTIGADNRATVCGAFTGWKCGATHVAWGEAVWNEDTEQEQTWHFDLLYGGTRNKPGAVNDTLCLKDRSLPDWLVYTAGDGCVSIDEGRFGGFGVAIRTITDVLPEPPVDLPPSPVPLPAAAWMLLAALAGLFGLRRRSRT